MTAGTVYAVASGKGGVGKTTTAVNLGAGFARAGRSVVVLDLDLGMANLADFLEASPAGPTLHEVLAGEATLDDALSHAEPNLDVIRGSEDLELFGRADPRGIRTILTDLRERYDVVILDSGGGLSHDTALPLGLADAIVLVSTVEEPAVKNTAKTLELADRLEGTLAGLVLTRVGGGKDEVDPTDIAASLDLTLLGSVPEDSTVKASAAEGEPLLSSNPDSPAAQAYLEIAYDLLDETLPVGFGDRDPAAVESVEQVAQSAEPETAGATGSADGSPPAEAPDPDDEEPADDTATAEAADSAAEAQSGDSDGQPAGEDGVAFDTEPEAVDPATTTEEDTAEGGEGDLVEEQAESEDEAESRSFLSKLTGGLLG